MVELSALFFASLLVSTLVPGGVEPYLYFLYQKGHGFFQLLVVATVGNTLGGIITFLIGGLVFRGTRKFHVHQKITQFFCVSEKSIKRLKKYDPRYYY